MFADIPDVKVKQFAAEARCLDVTSMNDLPEPKRLTLAAAFVLTQMTRAMDDVAEMFIRQVQRMHNKAHEALLRHQAEHADRTDALIALLRDVTLAYKTEGTREQRFAAIADLLGPDTEGILARCEAHRAVAGHNYLPLLPTFYRGRRGTLFRFLESVPLTSTSQDQALPQAIAFLLTHKASRQEWLPIIRLTRDHGEGRAADQPRGPLLRLGEVVATGHRHNQPGRGHHPGGPACLRTLRVLTDPAGVEVRGSLYSRQ